MADFLFRDRSQDEATENVPDLITKFQGMKYDKTYKSSTNSKKLKIVELMRESINSYLSSPLGASASLQDFSEASVAILREAR